MNSVYFCTSTRFMFCYSTVQCLHGERRSDPAGRGSSSTEREDNQAGRCNLRRWSEHRNEEMDRAKRTDRSVIDRIIARLISGAVAILHPTGSAVRIVVRVWRELYFRRVLWHTSSETGTFFRPALWHSLLVLDLLKSGLGESDGGRGGGCHVTFCIVDYFILMIKMIPLNILMR